ncbi:hypothetical protein F5050DRAFT_1750599 [Lentinula boryana]|uniref:UvrD-like helicase ATP-binding domain-containing protein n=1 Tax=Lentinula boryana TaxID=40481 RepID=A0ABQ8QGM2_9AGAR|nr:hypothetical protein F5050DRAFT_1750599 [Lentinula boryana]
MNIWHTQIIPDDLFLSSRLTSFAAIDAALAQFEALVDAHHQRTGILIADLLQTQQNAVPLVISCIRDDAFSLLRAHVSGLSQVDPKLFADSMALQLLTNLSHFLYFHDLPSSIFQSHDLIRNYYPIVQNAPIVLKLLSTAEYVEEVAIPEDEEDSFLDIRTRLKQKGKRHIRAKSKVLDPKPFKSLSLQVPSSQVEAQKLTLQLLQELENILDFYLDHLRNTDIRAAIKANFIPCVMTVIQDVEPGPHQGKQTSQIPEDIPVTFPKVQPMKAALHFDSIEGFGEWSIFISQNADTDLRIRHRRDKVSFDIIVKKIKELSNGHFSADNQKRLSGPSSEVPIFEAKMTGDLRLIYQIDVVANDDERERQAIKIFGIYTHAQMDNRMWESISRQLGRKCKEYRDRCAHRIKAENADNKTFVPALFPPLSEDEEVDSLNWLLDEDPVHSRFLMDKYVVFSQPLLNTMLADLDATFPHLVSTKEKQIIEHPHSCYVIGRSGTGKTTTLLFKMLLVERSHRIRGGDTPKPRQIFVTQSRILAKKVEQYFATLSHSLVASSQSLTQLRETRAGQRGAVLDDEVDMIDVDDIDDWSGDLPSKFSELCDEHFPLFTTFNGLCCMLEADIADAEGETKKHYTAPVSVGTVERGNLSLTYEVFLRDYWPRFSQSLARKLDPSLVFSELIGVIKGSEETLEDAKHFLDRTAYQSLSTRNQSTFAENREDLYELFMAYLTKKKKLGHVDGADRAHKILDFFKLQGVPGQRLDRLYVDEVQDNLLIDTLILRMLCHDENGLFWAGDTAQTISVGSSFRFNSLKAFQWRLEQKRRSLLTPSSQEGIEPQTFQLSVNYRSHSGIVDCAHSIIELITHFWKDSIDRLSPEKGVVTGMKPLFFVGLGEDAAGLDHFVFGDSGNRIEFGAHQCILVRNEAARDRLKSKLGDGVGLIMTIYDSKGLEFNDVLLYDFFGDSPAKISQWRLILSALNDCSMVTAPDFERNRQRYASICTELKFLYVAITRARENVWIVDSSESSEPMRVYWTERDLVRNIKPGTNTPKLATSSTPEDWARQGRILFDRKKWIEAKHCFARALQPENVAIAEAYHLRKEAERSSLDKYNMKLRNAQFRKAAEAFYKCSRSAGRKRMLDFVKLSGSCYEKAGEFLLAARNYELARRFNDAIRCYRKVDHYDEAVRIAQTETNVEPLLAADTIRVAKMLYFNRVQSLPSCPDRDKKLQQAGSLFDSVEDQLEYLEDRDMDIARAALLAAHGRTREAAELHLAEGRTLEAIKFFIRDTDTDRENSVRRAAECVLNGLWQKLTFSLSSEHLGEDSDFLNLLEFMQKIDQSSLTPGSRNELAMFQAIVNKDQTALRKLGSIFLKAKSLPAAVLCLDHYYTPPLPFDNLTVHQMADELDLFRQYSQILLDLLTNSRPAEQLGLCKVFGIQKLSDSHVCLPNGSYLRRNYPSDSPSQDLQLNMQDFMRYFRLCISNRLRDRVFEQNNICRVCKTFTPCLTYAVFGRCHREVLCHEAHLSTASLTDSFYNTRLRIHLQQILIVRILHSVYPYSSGTMVFQRSFWLNRLYDAIFPSSHTLGTLAVAQFQHITEFPKAMKIIQEWIRDSVYKRVFTPINTFLTDLMRLGTLAMIFDRPFALSQSLLHRGKYNFLTPPQIFERRGGAQIIHELIGLVEDDPQSNPNYLIAALLALKHVITDSVPIEIGLLCDLLEKLCRSLILVSCSHRDDNLHNITLPRSWLMQPVCVEEERRKQFSLLSLLISPIGDLLAQIYNGHSAGHLLYQNGDLAGNNVPIRARTVFISRVCRAICLLGYNIGNDSLRSNILTEMTSLRKLQRPDIQFPLLYRKYVEAHLWKDLASAVRRSTNGSAMDEMVNVVHKGRHDHTRYSPPGVRVVVYDKVEDIPSLLIGTIPPVASAITDVPRDIQILEASKAPVETLASPLPFKQLAWKTMHVEDKPVEAVAFTADPDASAANLEEELEEQIEDVAQQAIPFSINGPLVDETEIPEPTEHEHRNATIIQQAYRRYAHRKAKQRTQLAVSRNKWFNEYLKLDDIQNGRYRKMMLGPLPHIMVFLDLLHIGTQDSKNSTKRRLRLPLISEEAGLLDKQLTQVNNALKKTTKWKKTLEPQSIFHARRDCLQLRALVREIEEFIRTDLSEMPIKISLETKAEFEMGYKGIAQEPAPPKAVPSKVRKYELNTEDVNEL